MRTLVLAPALVLGCGGTHAPLPPPATQASPPATVAAPAATTTTHGDPASRRSATFVEAATPPATVWRDDAGDGALVAAPSSAPDRIAIALTATGTCDRGATCTYYEHTVPAGTQRQSATTTLAWRDYGPDHRFALLWGDVAAGPAGVLVLVRAGSAPFWHMHRNDVRTVVLAGTVEYVESGQAAHALAPGGYVLSPRGYKHTESCRANGPDCVLYVHAERGFDVKPL